MGYSGFLIKIGNYELSPDYINLNTYSVYANMQDLEPWTDTDGYLHRSAVKLKSIKVELETKPMLTNKTFSKIMRNIENNYTHKDGREFIMTAYIPEYDDYVTQTAYMADFQPMIYRVDKNTIYYNPVRLAFIGGVYPG